MPAQKKHGKGRLDKWYRLAKEKGYRARAAFKLIQLNKKYNFLEKSKVVIDLCAAPGSWCQVASECMPNNSLIIGVDLVPIKPIPRCITFQGDITTDKCRSILRHHLKSWKADTVLHDGAPNVGAAWVQDAFSQAELVLQSLKLATEFLVEGGTFVTKVFRSKDYNPLIWAFNQLFNKVEATKPPSSRTVSAEIFVVCRGFKAPKRIDPKLLDPRSIFAELADAKPNSEAKVFKPEIKKRKREGYAEGDYTQFKECPAIDFIRTDDPITMLASFNRFSLAEPPGGDIAAVTLDKLPETTREMRECCSDLKVLGRKDFKLLLKWRLTVRKIFAIVTESSDAGDEQQTKDKKPEEEGDEVAIVQNMDEEVQLQEEIQKMKDQLDHKKRKVRRKDNEKKRKDLFRMQMHMTAPMEIGLEQIGLLGENAVFDLKTAGKAGKESGFAKGKMFSKVDNEELEQQGEVEDTDDGDSDPEEDALEESLDAMYVDYQERKSNHDAKYRAKRRREDTEEWDGIIEAEDEDEDGLVEETGSEDSSDDGNDEITSGPPKKDHQGPTLLFGEEDFESKDENQLTMRANLFFDNDIFKGVADADESNPTDSSSDTLIGTDHTPGSSKQAFDSQMPGINAQTGSRADDDWKDGGSGGDGGIEFVKTDESERHRDSSEEPTKDGKPNIDIITEEAMTLAQSLATGKKSKHDIIDEGFNKYSHRDVDGLPEWFIDDENKHSRMLRPITAEAAAAIKEKMRALNARPIKKVLEAQARKKFKAAKRLQKLREKSAVLAEESDMTEKEKAEHISKLMRKAVKTKPKRSVTVVVAKGGNRGLSGRPQGTKGKYKMVDARLKKDTRALRRIAKKNKKKRH